MDSGVLPLSCSSVEEEKVVTIVPGKLYLIGDPDRTPGACVMHNVETGKTTWIDYGEVVMALAVNPHTEPFNTRIHPRSDVATILHGDSVYHIDAFFLTKEMETDDCRIR